jgi:nicotinamidase-related amidase
MRSALIVVDVQQSFTRRPYFSAEGVPAFLAAQNRLIEGFAAKGLPIVRVFHVSPGGDATDAFSPASGLVKPLEGLRDFDAGLEVRKTRHSALVGTGLDVWLTEQGVGEIVVSGIRTEQCCETTTRHASDLGWKAVFVPEATLTFDMTLPGGTPFRAADIVARTAAVLQGRFARVMDVTQTLAHVGTD